MRPPGEFNKDLNALIGITKALNRSTGLEETYRIALNLVSEQYKVDMIMIYLVNEEKNEALLEAHKNVPGDYIRNAGRIPFSKGLTWKVIQAGKMLYVEDIQMELDTGDASGGPGHHGVLGIPISLGDKTIGVIWFLSRKECKLKQSEIKMLSIIGGQIATAIARAKIFEEMKKRREALRQSEERYKDLFENVPSGIYRTTPDGRIIMANPALIRMLGYSSFDELATRNLEEEGFDVNYPRSKFKEIVEQKGEIGGLESAWLRNDGSLVYVLESTRAVRGEDGTVLYYEGTVENITERKYAEQSLINLAAAVEHAGEAIEIIDAEGRIQYVNPMFEKITGYTRSEVLGRTPASFLRNEENNEAFYTTIWDTISAGKGWSGELVDKRKDGSLYYQEVTVSPVRDSAGSTTHYVAIRRDVTDRKQAEEALRDSLSKLSKKNRYEMIISSVTQTVHRSINLQDVLENAVEAMNKHVNRADVVAIYIIEGEDAVLKAHKGLTDRYIERAERIPYPKGLTWKTILGGKPIYCPDVNTDTFIGSAGRELGMESYLSTPILSDGKGVGIMGIGSFEKSAFDEDELRLLGIVARQIETAINNARQVEALRLSKEALREARDELEIRVRERTTELATANKVLQAEIIERRRAEEALRGSLAQLSKKNRYEAIISAVTRSVHQSINLQEVLENAVEAMSTNIDRVDNVAIYLVEGQEAVMKAYKGFNERYIRRAGKVAYPKGITWKTIMEGKPSYVGDVDNDTVIGPAGRDLGIKSYLSMPISLRGQTTGALILTSFEKNAFDEEELRLLEIVARQIVSAINNAKRAEALQESKEELELRVRNRTQELSQINEELRKEILWRIQAEKALRVSEERYRTLVEHTYDLIAETSIDGKFLYVSPKHKDALGYETSELIGTKVFEYIHPDDLPAVMAEFAKAMKTISSGRAVFRFKHKNRNWRWLESTGKPFRTAIGEIRGVIASRDITERRRVDEQIKESLREKEVLLKEIHHRVKNNLQVVSSLINIQSQYTKSKKALEMFNETQNRIRSMALIHEQLYQSNNMAMIRFSEYVQNLLINLLHSYDRNPDAIKLRVNVDNIFLNIDTAIPCGLIINELVSNSMKHAFPDGRAGEIRVEVLLGNGLKERSTRSCFTMIVSDNGCSLPKDLDLQNTNSLGLQLVLDLVEQLGGVIELDRNAGTTFKIEFEEL